MKTFEHTLSDEHAATVEDLVRLRNPLDGEPTDEAMQKFVRDGLVTFLQNETASLNRIHQTAAMESEEGRASLQQARRQWVVAQQETTQAEADAKAAADAKAVSDNPVRAVSE